MAPDWLALWTTAPRIAPIDDDAAYIALAEALGCELLSGDVKLKNAPGHHATVIVSR